MFTFGKQSIKDIRFHTFRIVEVIKDKPYITFERKSSERKAEKLLP